MQCLDAELVLSRVLDDDWDELAARALRLHLSACMDCRESIANLLLVRAMCRVARGQWGTEKTRQVPET